MNVNYDRQEIKNDLIDQMLKLLRKVDRFEDIEVSLYKLKASDISKEVKEYYKETRAVCSEKNAIYITNDYIIGYARKAMKEMEDLDEATTLTVVDGMLVLKPEHISNLYVAIRLRN